MNPGPWGLLIIAIVVLLLFGRGKISGLMGEVAGGIKAFRKGLAEDEAQEEKPVATIDQKPGQAETTLDPVKDAATSKDA